jgi:hypothetical protein
MHFLISVTFNMDEEKLILEVSHYPAFFDFSYSNRLVKDNVWKAICDKMEIPGKLCFNIKLIIYKYIYIYLFKERYVTTDAAEPSDS